MLLLRVGVADDLLRCCFWMVPVEQLALPSASMDMPVADTNGGTLEITIGYEH